MTSTAASTTAPVHRAWPGLIEAYRPRLAGAADWTAITLREGGTPLLPAGHLSELTGCDVYLKVEGLNPTGSFKDRGMTMAITDAHAAFPAWRALTGKARGEFLHKIADELAGGGFLASPIAQEHDRIGVPDRDLPQLAARRR